jgi:hypothetical protein
VHNFSYYVYFFSLHVSGNCAHHQEKQLYLYDSLVCIQDGHPRRITSIKCRINTVVSPDDGHTVAQNVERKEMNILRRIMHQVGFIYKIYVVFTADASSEN